MGVRLLKTLLMKTLLFILPTLLVTSSCISQTPYNRNEWSHWIDNDRDCQNSRHEKLIRESLAPVSFKSNRQCKPDSGLWHDQFTGKTFTDQGDLDLDHIIPLKWAHAHGGWQWSSDRKKQFANDYLNLILVNDTENRRKSSKGPGDWMPPNQAFHCDYAFRWGYLINKYKLTPNPHDQAKIEETEAICQLN